jgi:hypothetical protein
MKKFAFTLCLVPALLVLINASVWEGAAASTPRGDLPETGFYAATNSFPRNTVVDVTNLENGKTIRVIVSGGLDTPGLLTILSKDAANFIGLSPHSIGRVRMTQPADPIAFSRFTEGRGSSGDPDYDPAAQLAAAGRDVTEPVPEGEAAETKDETPPAPATAAAGEAPPAGAVDESPGLAAEVPAPGAAEPEEEPPPAATEDLSIVDVPEAYEPLPSLGTDEGIVNEPGPELAEAAPENPDPAVEAEKSSGGDEYEYALVPAEELPPEAELPVITGEYEASPVEDISPADETIPEYALIEAIPGAAPEAEPTEKEYRIDESKIITAIPEGGKESAGTEKETPAPLPAALKSMEGRFSVPLIADLERGKYYLQLAAYNKAESVEKELTRIGSAWPLTVQASGSPEQPLYRILVGPVNLGESGALLQRFKGSGYADAFITPYPNRGGR